MVTFELNGLSRRFIGPLDVTELHRLVREGMSFLYMRGGRAASTFRWLMRMRPHLVRTEYKEVEKIESCSLMYAFKNNTIEVRVLRENRVGKLIVANELSGALFDLLLHDGKPFKLGPWTRCSSRSPVLLSSRLGIYLNFTIPKDVEVFAGREVMPPRLNWAGVDLVMNEGLAETSYSVSVDLDSQQRARG
ncbi:MAG: hypothetical protein NZ733_02205 [Aigarchaeota archaeon]|nr:hypothetical protein [Aigarchaeota archaeon]